MLLRVCRACCYVQKARVQIPFHVERPWYAVTALGEEVS